MGHNASLHVVLLIAGRGSRLGADIPKCLTEIEPGVTILDRQLDAAACLPGAHVAAVTGFREDLIADRHPQLRLVSNPDYARTNTAKSLLLALNGLGPGDLLWLNGDVIFEQGILPLVGQQESSCMAVNTAQCGAEEIKYRTDHSGLIREVSKSVQPGEGEAVGINLVKQKDVALFQDCLRECADMDYFEKGLELAIDRGLKLAPLDISRFNCIEVDFPEDLEKAQNMFSG